jgi:DNA primase
MDAVAEIKARLNIEDVVAQYVQLKRAGRNFKGISPWTNEKTASFIVSPEKGIWHDFSSGKGGDVFGFVMEMDGLDFRGALEQLARQAGVDLEQFRGESNDLARSRKARALEALALAARFYQQHLIASRPALDYLKKRGLNKQTLLDWQLGYSPNSGNPLTDFLTKKGFETDETRAAGLSVIRSGRPADMFRGRIMIPLADSRGTVVGFTARLLADDPDAPKYINTPQTVVYDKSRNVFGLHLAKEAIRKEGFVVAVEGQLDVISSHQAGIKNVIASSGTAMTEMHLRELKRFTGDIRLCFDADRAGIAATERVIPLAQKVEVNLRIITIQEGLDPDELVQKDLKAWRTAIDKAAYAPDWLMERYKDELDLSTAQGKKAFTDALLPTIRRLRDPVEQEHYLKQIAEITDTSYEAIKAKFGGAEPDNQVLRKPRNQSSSEPLDLGLVEYHKLQDNLLAMVLMQPKLRDLLKSLEPDFFSTGERRAVFEFLRQNPDFKGQAATAKQLQQQWDYVKIITLQFEELYQSLAYEDLRDTAINLKRRLLDRYVKMQKRTLAEAMQAETDEKKLAKLVRQADQLNALIK